MKNKTPSLIIPAFLTIFGLSFVTAVHANDKTFSFECTNNSYLAVDVYDLKPTSVRVSNKKGVFEQSTKSLSGSTYINKTTFEILSLKANGQMILAKFYDTGLAYEQDKDAETVVCTARGI